MNGKLPLQDRLPSKEGIAAMTDVIAIDAIIDETMASIKQVEVDLEFCDIGDEGWRARARTALSCMHVVKTRLEQRRRQLTRTGAIQPQGEGRAEKQARKAEAQAALLIAQKDHKVSKAAEEREKTIRQMMLFTERHSFLAHFYKVAAEELGNAVMGKLVHAARAQLQSLADPQ